VPSFVAAAFDGRVAVALPAAQTEMLDAARLIGLELGQLHRADTKEPGCQDAVHRA
jgi:hypothetical protein